MTPFIRPNAFQMAIALTTLALLTLTGCGGGDNSVTSPIDPTVGQTRKANNLEFNLTTTKSSFRLGENVPLTFSVKNLSQSAVTIRGFSPTDSYEITLNGRVIDMGPAGTGGSFSLTLAPGEKRVFTTDYVFTSPANVVGSYQVSMWLNPGTINGQSVTTDPKTTDYANPITLSIQPT